VVQLSRLAHASQALVIGHYAHRLVETLVEALTDEKRAENALGFPVDRELSSHPGLYSWWADSDARSLIGQQLGVGVRALVYAGQAGATRWPSGKKSTATLASRIRSNHINGNASSSTFRLTLSALLLEPLNLQVAKRGRLAPEANRAVSVWIKDHLRVAIVAFDCRETLGRIEAAVLDVLDPPLNIEGRPSAPWRSRLAQLRMRITMFHDEGAQTTANVPSP
jgi:hypothetical protein